ncbi:MAG: right-handed parallel beta-helix repeat-containing protein [Sedimentisphaerales bacterium]|jgi:polygalacturonase|nr:right-handed parallel beta-helix repeat-containing protein [Sedimentisphaerales bacterium]HNY78947.1 glycosyl hydrolase family 28-related protein [Sedimentisphaerales bacterium]HOC62637.1 glycosyl hydrolase family 28-related protein [Sedimentisphaerales bacterium]HOH64835.1 glycosyl hydrolase family 28-related protein [Sedimentisphaerales bacterium]HPY49231.1 glycosyl hydrolase family 28-related protein [Sedimentisphaerales bacterium]
MLARQERCDRYRIGFLVLWLLAWSHVAFAGQASVFDVRNYGAVGDGVTVDTAAINRAVETCATSGGGQVRFAPGRYLSATIHLQSHITLLLEPGARLVGAQDPNLYEAPKPPDFMPEARWGKWHRALILAEGQEDIAICGGGVIDGNKVFDPTGEEHMRGPHTFVFVDCCDVTVRDVSFVDSANYAIFFMVSSNVDIHNVTFTGGWDGVHFRGAPGHACRHVDITDCRFYTGDDSIAGRYWENTVISGCIINSSCNGIRLIGPAENLIIHDCLFYGSGLHPHRTSDRYNMLAGINLQPGAWDATKGRLDDVLISDVTMRNVATPLHFTMKAGNTADHITVTRLSATNVYRAACSVESWAETPFENVVFRDVDVEFEGGGTVDEVSGVVRAPGVDARPLPAWGLYARNVQNLALEDVRLTCRQPDQRPVMICEDVNDLTLDTFEFPACDGAATSIILRQVERLRLRDTDASVVQIDPGRRPRRLP